MNTIGLSDFSQLLSLLSEKNKSHNETWFTIGCIYYHISKGSEKGLHEWIACYTHTDFFNEDYCRSKWTSMKHYPYSIHTILNYVKENNMEAFIQYKQRICKKKLFHIISLCHETIPEYPIAEALYLLCMDEFVYNDNGWFRYEEGKWIKTKQCIELKKYIQQLKEFMMEENKILKQKRSVMVDKVRDLEEVEIQDKSEEWKTEYEELQQESHLLETKITTFTNVQLHLDKSSCKNAILMECKELFYDPRVQVTNESKMNNEYNNPENYMKDEIKSKNNILELFVQYFITDNEYTWNDIILITSEELLYKYNQFTKKHNINETITSISLIRKLNKLHIKGITTSIRCHSVNKTKFDKREIQNFFV